jgi:hypothetical protein
MPINEYDATHEVDFKSASYSHFTAHLVMFHLKYFTKHFPYFVSLQCLVHVETRTLNVK